MKLTHGSYYKTDEEEIVFCQLENDGCFGVYNVAGDEVMRHPKFKLVEQDEEDDDGNVVTKEIEVDNHVEGWTPCGAAEFKQARLDLRGIDPKTYEKPAKKKKGKAATEEAAGDDATTDPEG